MVTFRKDIHLGRRVPFVPDTNSSGMIVSISDEGLAIDKYGRQWRLSPWGTIVAVPSITVADVTNDTVAGKREAIYLVTIEHEDQEAEIKYKIIKNDDEPTAWSTYEEPFTIRENGTYQIVAKAKKQGETDSEIIKSDAFKVTRVAVSENYSAIIVTQFKYDDVSYLGGTAKPKLSYQQTGSRTYTDGTTESITPVTTGATLTFSRTGGIDTLTGDFAVPSWVYTNRHSLGTVTLVIALNGQTVTKTTEVYQTGAADKPANQILWVTGKNPGEHHYNQGTVLTVGVDFEAYTNDDAAITYYTYEGTQRVQIVDTVTITKSMRIEAEAAETAMYRKTIKEEQIFVKGIPIMYYGYGISQTSLEEIVNDGDGAALVSPYAQYPFGEIYGYGNINEEIDNSGVSGAVLWLAIAAEVNVNDLLVYVKQGSFDVKINAWNSCDSTFQENGKVFYVLHTPLPVEMATLSKITLKRV